MILAQVQLALSVSVTHSFLYSHVHTRTHARTHTHAHTHYPQAPADSQQEGTEETVFHNDAELSTPVPPSYEVNNNKSVQLETIESSTKHMNTPHNSHFTGCSCLPCGC